MSEMGDLKFTTAGDYMRYDRNYAKAVLKVFDPMNVRSWPFYPIVVPLKDGQGPASDKECDEITWEVWDHFCNSYGSFKYLADAINESMKLTKELFGCISLQV